MSGAGTMIGRDLYYRITPANGKPSRVARARVWDAETFLEAQTKAGREADPRDRFAISPATEAEFDPKA